MAPGPTDAERDADDAMNMLGHYLKVTGASAEAQSAIERWVLVYGKAMKEQGKAEA